MEPMLDKKKVAGLFLYRGSKMGSVSYTKPDFKSGPNHAVELILYACAPTLPRPPNATHRERQVLQL